MISIKQVTEISLRLLGHLNSKGMVDSNKEAKYFNVSPAYCDILQRELLMREGFFNTDNHLAFTAVTVNGVITYTAIPVPMITSLIDNLKITDDTALRVLPFGLAAYLALIDNDTVMYNTMSLNYNNAIQSIIVADNKPIDYYGILSDADFRQ